MKSITIKLILVALTLNSYSCSEESGGSSGAPNETNDVRTAAAISQIIEAGEYTSWFGHTDVEDSQSGSPHGKMRTFLNATLKTSYDANNSEHPVGSVSIKELYNSAGTEITGYAYSEKITTGTDRESWLWWEDLDLSTSAESFYGVGISTCAGCHSSGTDYIRIQF